MRRTVPADAQLIPKDAKLVFKGIIFDTYQWQQQMFDDSYQTFEMLKRKDSVSIVSVIDDKILIMNELQPGDKWRLRFPGGGVDQAEQQLDAAKRELFEETGLKFSNWRLINAYQPYSKIDWCVCTYLATENTTELNSDLNNEGEKAVSKLYIFNEAKKLIMSDRSGYLHYDREYFEDLDSIEDLLNVSTFKGKVIDD